MRGTKVDFKKGFRTLGTARYMEREQSLSTFSSPTSLVTARDLTWPVRGHNPESPVTRYQGPYPVPQVAQTDKSGETSLLGQPGSLRVGAKKRAGMGLGLSSTQQERGVRGGPQPSTPHTLHSEAIAGGGVGTGVKSIPSQPLQSPGYLLTLRMGQIAILSTSRIG